jgi:hypothetical protein
VTQDSALQQAPAARAAIPSELSAAGTRYFERRGPIALILGVFVLCVVPLALLQLIPNYLGFVPHLTLFVAVGLGTSHFFLTLAVFLDAQHRAYFASSRQRQLLYFGLPALILGLLAWIEAAQLRASHAAAVTLFFSVVRFLDFLHVGRQGYGMLQLLKRPPAGHVASHPEWLRPSENALFVGLAVMQWQTFWLGGQWSADRMQALLPALGFGALAAAIASQHVRAILRGQPRAWVPATYFVIQAACSAAAVYRTSLYITVLAVHYLEYHVIMYPRLAAQPSSATTARTPRAFALRPLFVYATLAIVVVAFELRNTFTPGSFASSFLIHIFDGIFLLHYTLDAFLWRFGQPFYRTRLGPLYFEPIPATSRATQARPWLFSLGALSVLAAIGLMSGLAERVDRAIIAPMDADNHIRWGYELARRGQLQEAKDHMLEALKRDPTAEYAKTGLSWIEEQSRGIRSAP